MKNLFFVFVLIVIQIFTFSTGLTANITIISPNGGENWEIGKRYFVKWTSDSLTGTAHLDYSTNNGGSWTRFATGTNNDGARYWDVPNIASDKCLIRITKSDGSAQDVSDSVFSIITPSSITITSPNGGEQWDMGKRYFVNWTSNSFTGTAHLDYSTNNGGSWTRFATATNNDGSRYWDVPNKPSSNCLIRITKSDGSAQDVSDAVFSIITPSSITITSPNGGEQWDMGKRYFVNWTSNSFTGTAHLDYSTNNGGSWTRFATGTNNDGARYWDVPYIPTNKCLIRITKSDGSAQDVSDAVFSLKSKYNWVNKFNTEYNNAWKTGLENLSNGLSENGLKDFGVRAYRYLGYGIDSLTAMYEVTGNKSYLDDALGFVANVINDAADYSVFPDDYLGWIGGSDSGRPGQVVVLWESIGWRYVTKLLRVMKKNSLHIDPNYENQFNQILSFTEINIWDKWYNRGNKQQYIYRSTTHTTSHWAYIALNIYGLTSDSTRKDQCEGVFTTINDKLNSNLQNVPPNAYFWFSTWGTSSGNVQDVLHGNHVLSYICEAYQQGVFWTDEHMIKFKNTLKEIIWHENECDFANYVNGDFGPVDGYDHTGRKQADGWLKLGRYFNDIISLYESSLSCGFTPNVIRPGHFYANMALNEKKFNEIIENP